MMRKLGLWLIVLILSGLTSCASPQWTQSQNTATNGAFPVPSTRIASSYEAPQPVFSPSIATEVSSSAECAQPCWEGLRPGKTTRQDLERYFETQFDSDWRANLMIDTAAEGKCRGYIWKSTVGGRQRQAYVENEVLAYLEIVADPGLSLGAVVEQYGPPEYVYAVAETVSGSSRSMPVRSALYPQQGLAFDLYAKDTCELRPEYLISTIKYFVPGNLLAALRARVWCSQTASEYSFVEAEQDAYYMQPWRGFGEIQVFYKELDIQPIQKRTPAATPRSVIGH